MILEGNPKRACIYFFYDKDGVVDEYVIQQLRDMRENAEFIHCVVNGKLTEKSEKILSAVSDEIYIRENKGNDIGAYKAAIVHIGWEKIRTFDELILMNNTCFGPVYPFKEVFSWAEKKDVDYWGLTSGMKVDWYGNGKKYLHYNKKKTHIQSYFLVLRKSLLKTQLIEDFFNEIPDDNSYADSGSVYEYAFPGYFEERGYYGAVYCDVTDDYNYPLLHDPVRLLRDYRMPLFKKRSFFHHYTDVLNNTAGESTARLIQFLQEETSYDMSLVWTSLLRTCSLSDLVRCAQLNRVLPDDISKHPSINPKTKIGVIYHAYYEDLFDESLDYIANFPEKTDILFTIGNEEKKKKLEEKMAEHHIHGQVIIIENRGRDVSSLLVGAAKFVFDHDLICFAHDKKTKQVKPESVGRAWRYKLNENLFGSCKYVENVIDLFEKEPQLGIAFPAYPLHSGYACTLGTGWTGNFKNTKDLLESFDVHVKINEHTLCVAPLGTYFWFRPKALKKLFEGVDGSGWKYSDFPKEPNGNDNTILHAIERSYAYFAQDAGYYPVYIYNSRYTEIELTNLEFNKTGSANMRAWVDYLGTASLNGDLGKNNEPAANDQSVIAAYDQKINYGIKNSLLHLAYAIRCKFPRMWAILLPIRRITQKILGIKTR